MAATNSRCSRPRSGTRRSLALTGAAVRAGHNRLASRRTFPPSVRRSNGSTEAGLSSQQKLPLAPAGRAFNHRNLRVEDRSGHPTREVAPLKRSIYSLIDLREILLGRNQRYLEFLSSLDDHSSGQRLLERLTEPRPDGDRRFKGLNFFDHHDQSLLRAVQRLEFNIHGVAPGAT